MRLIDLNPRWVGIVGWSSDSIYHIGVTFNSPLTGKRLAVLFVPPIDPDGLAQKYGWNHTPFPDQNYWSRRGDTFENLDLSPSIDFSKHGEWHGHIIGGEIR